MTTRAAWPAIALVAASISGVPIASGSPDASQRDSLAVPRAESIRLEVSSRYARSGNDGLEVTEASSTGVVESFTLLSAHLTEARIVPAGNGVYYSICPVNAECPYPERRFAHSAASFVPRRIALELAVRTFQEMSADVVAISLPTRRFVLIIIERTEFAQDELSSLAKALARSRRQSASVALHRLVDRATRPRVYAVIGLESTPSGRDTLGAVPVWPNAGTEESE
jgi:hypothetical protein